MVPLEFTEVCSAQRLNHLNSTLLEEVVIDIRKVVFGEATGPYPPIKRPPSVAVFGRGFPLIQSGVEFALASCRSKYPAWLFRRRLRWRLLRFISGHQRLLRPANG
jgi:hypothetical protein